MQPSPPPETQNPPKHPFHLALRWRDQLAGNPRLTQAGIAAREGLSRARVTQIMNLLRLPETIQSLLQNLSPPLNIHSFSERQLRRLLTIGDSVHQLLAWQDLLQKLGHQDGR